MKRIAYTASLLLFSLSVHAQQWITGYYGTNNGYEAPSSIPWSKYTHMIHFAAVPGVDGSGTGNGTVGMAWLSQSDINAFVAAAHANGKKALISIKDNDSYQYAFSQSTTSGRIATFANNIAAFVKNNGYDGVDLDWENNIVVSQYQDLFNRVRAALPNSLIVTAMNNGNGMPTVAAAVQSKVDQINIMCYDMDYQGINGGYVWHNDALFQSGSGLRTCDFTMNVFTNAGVAPSKLGVGLPYYVRVWKGATLPLQKGSFSTSTIFYRDLVTNSSLWQSQYQVYDNTYKANYLSIPSLNQFISYTGVQEIQDAVAWSKSRGFGGLMTFAQDQEFLPNQSGDARYPLSTALYNAVANGVQPPPSNAAPVISSGSPSGTLNSGTAQTTMAVVTNENATCKYATGSGFAYSAMPNLFSTTGGTSHSTSIGNLTNGGTYRYYVRCSDAAGIANSTDYPILFSVGQASAPVQPGPTLTASPSTGTGAAQTFAIQVTDASGYSAVLGTDVVFGTAVGVANSCMVEWWAPNVLALKSDDNSTWMQTTLGSSTTLHNTQCSVNAAASSVSGSGSTQNLNLAMSFATSYAGAKSIFALASNQAGLSSGWQTLGTWTVPVPVAQSAPTGAITPASGTGTSQTFALQISDSGGYSTIQGADIVFGTAVGVANSCMVEFWSPNILALKSDDNTRWMSTTLGSSSVLSNNQCSVSAAGSSVSGSGNTLAVKLALSFARSYSGAKTVYALSSDKSGLNSGWQKLGTWTVPAIVAAAPTLAITPSSGRGARQTFTLSATDANGYGSVQGADIVFGPSIGAPNSCMVEYWAPNILALKSNDNTRWLSTTFGSSQVLRNNQCSVDAAASSLTGSGNILKINLRMSFSSSYRVGTISAIASDLSGTTSGWLALGSWSAQ